MSLQTCNALVDNLQIVLLHSSMITKVMVGKLFLSSERPVATVTTESNVKMNSLVMSLQVMPLQECFVTLLAAVFSNQSLFQHTSFLVLYKLCKTNRTLASKIDKIPGLQLHANDECS